jgi:hypothetical protein
MARVTIPDHLFEHYQAIADRQGRPLDAVIEAQLSRFQHCPPGERTLAMNVEKVEKVLGGTPIRDGQDLLTRLEHLAGITFHGIRLDFSPAQLEELARRASREGKSVEELAAQIAEQLNRQFFWGAEAAEAVR